MTYAEWIISRGGGVIAGSQHLGVFAAPDESYVFQTPPGWIFFPVEESIRELGKRGATKLLQECLDTANCGRPAIGLPPAKSEKSTPIRYTVEERVAEWFLFGTTAISYLNHLRIPWSSSDVDKLPSRPACLL